jgi:hypothetical protein
MRVLVSSMALRLPYRTKFRVFTGKAYTLTPHCTATEIIFGTDSRPCKNNGLPGS